MLNVRLGPEDQRIAVALRRAGIPVSSLVREALRAEFKRVHGKRTRSPRSRIVELILEETPVGPQERALAVATDRKGLQRLVQAKLGRGA